MASCAEANTLGSESNFYDLNRLLARAACGINFNCKSPFKNLDELEKKLAVNNNRLPTLGFHFLPPPNTPNNKIEELSRDRLYRLVSLNPAINTPLLGKSLTIRRPALIMEKNVISASSFQSTISLSNYSGIAEMLETIEKSFSSLFKRMAYLHHFTGEGMDQMEFTEAASNIKEIISSYKEMGGQEGSA